MNDTTDPPPARPTRIRWLIFALACGTSMLLYLHRYTWNIVSERLATEQGYSRTELGLLSGLFNGAYALGQIPSGIVCDLFGPHFFLAILIVLWSLALCGQGLTTSLPGLAAARVVFGLTQAGGYPSLNKASQLWFPPASRTILQGWIASVFGRGGAALSPLLMSTFLIGYWGLSWQRALFVMAAIGLAFAVGFALLFRNSPAVDPRVNDEERDEINAGRLAATSATRNVLPWSEALRNRSLRFLLLQQFCSAGADSFYSNWLGTYFKDTWNLAKGDAGWLLSVPLIGGALGGMIGAYLNDAAIRRTGNRRWSRSAIGMIGPFVAAGLVLTISGQPSAAAAGMTLLTVKLFVDWGQPTVWGTTTDVGGRYSATVFSIVNTSGTVGSVVAPFVFGPLLDASTNPATNTPSYYGVFLVIAGLYVVSGLSWLGIDCTRTLESVDPPPAAQEPRSVS